MKILKADYHRNGIGGRGFYVGIVEYSPEDGDQLEGKFLITSFSGNPVDPDAAYGDDLAISVLDIAGVVEGNIGWGNSWRGDMFTVEAQAVKDKWLADR